MFTADDEKKSVDCFSLFDTLESSDYEVKKTKDFLTNKFIISFDEISKSISKNVQADSNIIDIIYDCIDSYAFGYSLNSFCESTYMEYSHRNGLLNSKDPLLKECNEQIKYFCLISSLYTILAVYNKDNYRNYFDVAKEYSHKRYMTSDDQTPYYAGYEKNSKVEERIRSAYDLLCKTYESVSVNEEYNDLKDIIKREYLILTDEYLRKAFNYKYNKSREINIFLEEFSFDLIVNQMQGGFHILSKVKALRNNQRKNIDNFRRETRRFLKGLGIIDKNFHPNKSDKIDSLLYYWKRESLFHINIFKYLINTNENEMLLKHGSDLLAFPTLESFTPFTSLFERILNMEDKARDLTFIMRYLSEITFPVYAYTFFIALCEHFDYSLENIKNELISYIEESSIKMEMSDALLETNSIKKRSADKLGEAIIDTFQNGIRFPRLDDSFDVNVNYIGYEGIPVFLKQSSLGLAYYQNILQ